MLFCIDSSSPRSKILWSLNECFKSFLIHAVEANDFNQNLFVNSIGQACYENSKTQEKFLEFFEQLKGMSIDEQIKFQRDIESNQCLELFYTAPNFDIVPRSLKSSFQALMIHLFEATSRLQKIINGSESECLNLHYKSYLDYNGKVCRACGLDILSEHREGIDAKDQWRADYDHQLAKSIYPMFAVHPDNIIPLCNTCNQKAKKAKDVLRDTNKKVRKTLYHYTESAYGNITISLKNEIDPEPSIGFDMLPSERDEKIKTWVDTYEIAARVEGKYKNIVNYLADSLSSQDFDEFCSDLKSSAKKPNPRNLSNTPNSFWDFKFYTCLNEVEISTKEALWECIQNEANNGKTSCNQLQLFDL